ncbi:MAG: hypothetical protein H6740_04140 [Alphaproteobacteria bacterium]|nr:hypothetical protein [Alphaproteobacteria bacterium]
MADRDPEDGLEPALSGRSREAYGERYDAHLLEQYMLAVEMADRTSTRRQEANRYFLGINSALVAFTALFAVPAQPSETGAVISPLGILVLAVVGAAISTLWFRLLRYFRTLNEAKYKVIRALEERLPARPYAAEWAHLSHRPGTRGQSLTRIEVGVPLVFGLLHLAIAGYAVLELYQRAGGGS